jgi:hypothetical protein
MEGLAKQPDAVAANLEEDEAYPLAPEALFKKMKWAAC